MLSVGKTKICNFLLLSSVSRFGDFSKFLATFFPTLVVQIFTDFWAFLKRSFKVKTAVSSFWATFVEIWVTFHYNIWSHWL